MRNNKKYNIGSVLATMALCSVAGFSQAAIKTITVTGVADLYDSLKDDQGYGTIHTRSFAVSNNAALTAGTLYESVPDNLIGEYSRNSQLGTPGFKNQTYNIEEFSSVEAIYKSTFNIVESPLVDLAHSGFNTETGVYEIQFTIEQYVDTGTVLGWIFMPSILKYDPVSGLAFLQSLRCVEKYTISEAITVNNETGKFYGPMCSLAGVTKVRRLQLDKSPAGFSTSGKPLFALGEISSIKFDGGNPSEFSIVTPDLAGMQLGVEFEMRSVPVPAAVWLFGSAMLGLLGVSRNRKNNKV